MTTIENIAVVMFLRVDKARERERERIGNDSTTLSVTLSLDRAISVEILSTFTFKHSRSLAGIVAAVAGNGLKGGISQVETETVEKCL